MSELELLKKGDSHLMKTLYGECFGKISSWVQKNNGCSKDAEDVFQDAITTTYKKAVGNDLELTCQLSTFLFSVSRNVWLHKLRSQKRMLNADLPDLNVMLKPEADKVDCFYRDPELNQLLDSAFASLCPDCQKILSLHFDGFSIKAIAETMDYQTENQTRKKKFRCKNKLVDFMRSRPEFAELAQN